MPHLDANSGRSAQRLALYAQLLNQLLGRDPPRLVFLCEFPPQGKAHTYKHPLPTSLWVDATAIPFPISSHLWYELIDKQWPQRAAPGPAGGRGCGRSGQAVPHPQPRSSEAGVQLRLLRQRVVMTAQKAQADVLLHRLHYALPGWDAAAERRDAQDELHSAASPGKGVG
jgi:hypothetical protein